MRKACAWLKMAASRCSCLLYWSSEPPGHGRHAVVLGPPPQRRLSCSREPPAAVASTEQSTMSMKIEPKPVAPLPATSQAVVMVMAVDYASARHIREARVGGEWHVRGWSCRPREA